MCGIYIHIPFCKQACHYCDFHFSTSLKKKEAVLQAIKKELEFRKEELAGAPLRSIYFGGGTPSLLKGVEIEDILNTIDQHFSVEEAVEITLEANPDDLSSEVIDIIASAGVNRLSIGVQSFFDQDLKLMNRAHDSIQSRSSLELAKQKFENISIDLIYGIPGLSNSRWRENLEIALRYDLPHISSYALTVEPKTALKSFIEKGIIANVDEVVAEEQFKIQNEVLEKAAYVHYEISNFGKPGYFAVNNTAYWQGEHYLGVGPSAHSYDGLRRSWNIRNNSRYIKAVAEGNIPTEKEKLSTRDRYNEYVMTGLRTIWGVSLNKVGQDFGDKYRQYLMDQAGEYIGEKLLYLENDLIRATEEGKFLIDGIASHLFMLNLGK